MNIKGICVSVNYADLLQRGLDRWHTGLDRMVVITSKSDTKTQVLCDRNNIECFVTDIFYENGAKFNKGAAISEAVHVLGLRNESDWLMTFDSDIVPPENWRVLLERMGVVPGHLYGSWRYWLPEDSPNLIPDLSKRMPQGWVLGFFSLFHSKDPILQPGPLFDICWPHGGNYDTIFTRQWPKYKQIILPLNMIHLGEERQNWCGRYNRQELRTILEARHGWGDWEKERMPNPPFIKGLTCTTKGKE